MSAHNLIWFRNDLRLSDNPALHEACKRVDKVTAVFFLTPQQWKSHHLSLRRIAFTKDALRSLQKDLAALGVELHVLTTPKFASVAHRLVEFCRERHTQQVFFNAEYGLDETVRDQAALKACERNGIAVFISHGSVVIPPGAVVNKQNAPYRVFTPFKRAWLQTLQEYDRRPLPAPKSVAHAIPKSRLAAIPEGRKVDLGQFPASEAEAHGRLQKFVELGLANYHRDRDIPAVQGTSRLSPYLALGLISPRACLHAARLANRGEVTSGSAGAQAWINEIVWREFYIHILAAFPGLCRHEPFRTNTDAVPWRRDEEDFKRWCAGDTGFPLVDAAMRQLNTTGWMHNRLRMVTAMFLSKYLLIDWRWGERYFMERLVDGHFAANNGGWQWCASTGADAAPFFRLLSPVRQAERFDPKAEFIKSQLPGLRRLPAGVIHKPGNPDLLATGYPAPMIDLRAAKEDCISAFKSALAG